MKRVLPSTFYRHFICLPLAAGNLLFAGITQASSEYELPALKLEDLMEINVTSVSKKSQKLSETPSAVYVISQEEIRRSGATTLPEILRMAPGVHVARIDAGKWSVSIRGFSGVFSNKLLVLMDGRTLYNSLYSGVYWEEHAVIPEDIERIEIIRGPGASVWGANAVNGVINIITKQAAETRYGYLAAHGGNLDKGGALRYGRSLGDDTQARAYFKYARQRDGGPAGGVYPGTEVKTWHAGGRLDTLVGENDSVALLADARQGETGRQRTSVAWLAPPRVLTDREEFQGGNLVLRWQRQGGEGRETQIQTYIEQTKRKSQTLEQRITTFSADWQQRLRLGNTHDFIWGTGYARNQDDLEGSFTVSLKPDSRTGEVYSLFIQDEMCLRKNLCLTAGSKFEHNSYSGFEYQPSVRILWGLEEYGVIWAALSRAVHTPSRFDHDSRLNVASVPGEPPVLISLLGNDGVEAENVLAWEAGYRGYLRSDLSWDAAFFYNQYSDLKTRESNRPTFETVPLPPHLLVSSTTRNFMEGENYGLELNWVWQARQNWRIKAGGSWLYSDMRLLAESQDAERIARIEGDSPEWQFKLQSYWEPNNRLAVDVFYYYSASLPLYGLPAYSRLDIRLGWQADNGLEFNLSAYNLLNDRHVEYESLDASIPTEVSRGVYGELIWRF